MSLNSDIQTAGVKSFQDRVTAAITRVAVDEWTAATTASARDQARRQFASYAQHNARLLAERLSLSVAIEDGLITNNDAEVLAVVAARWSAWANLPPEETP